MNGNETSSLLEIKNLSKSFPGVEALGNVRFNLKHGEIHGLLGENGAGKSTLIKVMTGVYARNSGSMRLEGEEFEFRSAVDAPKHGISTVYQEINLIPGLSVAENIFLGRQPLKYGNINWKKINLHASEVLSRLNIDIDVTKELSSYSIAMQQMVAIARALDIKAKILILDEPTSSLDSSEVGELFKVMKKLKEDGIGIIFITHFLDQVYEITDRITVLRNGHYVGCFETSKLEKVQLIAHMLGKDFKDIEHGPGITENQEGSDTARDEILLKINRMEHSGIKPFSLTVKKGEVLGLAGLLGSGRTEIARLLFGLDKPSVCDAELHGQKLKIKSPKQAIMSSFALCPENRREDGIIPDLSVRENMIMALQARKGIFRRLSHKQQMEIVDKYIKELNIVTPHSEQKIKNLSGGNQQKVIFARWLVSNPKFLILDEPTRGIDVGVKADIQELVGKLSAEGMSVLFISSELDEVIRCSARVLVLRDREIVDELTGEDINDQKIMHIIAE